MPATDPVRIKANGDQFPVKITIHVPFPTPRLASIALAALSVDKELSPSVSRDFSVVRSPVQRPKNVYSGAIDGVSHSSAAVMDPRTANPPGQNGSREIWSSAEEEEKVLRVDYAATTHRMLRVAVNGFFENLGVVMECMRDLDLDVAMWPGKQSLENVQGLEEVKSKR